MKKEVFDEDFSIGHNISVNWGLKEFHLHDSYEIYFAMTNDVKYFVGDRIYDVEKGMIFVFNSTEIHRTLVPANIEYERYILLFKPGYIQDIPSLDADLLECFLNRKPGFSHGVKLSGPQQEELIDLFEKADLYISNNVYGQEAHKKIILARILLFVNEIYRKSAKKYFPENESEYRRILPVIKYIQANTSTDLSLKSLSERFYISAYHLGYLFKKATGFSVNQYIINYKILKACELLKKDCNVTEVSEKIGYNLPHFIRTFKKKTGNSPKQYALKNR